MPEFILACIFAVVAFFAGGIVATWGVTQRLLEQDEQILDLSRQLAERMTDDTRR